MRIPARTIWIVPAAWLLSATGAVRAAPPDDSDEQAVSLSVVIAGPDGCEWQRIDVPSGHAHRIALLRNKYLSFRCPDSPTIAWSHDGKRALLQKDDDDLFRVNLLTGAQRPLPPLPESAGDIREFGFDSADNVMVLAIQTTPDADGKFHWHGKVYSPPPPDEGLPALAHAFVLGKSGHWHDREVKESDDGGDYTRGITVLAACEELYTGLPRDDLWEPGGTPVRDRALLRRLDALFGDKPEETGDAGLPGRDDEGGWVQLDTDPPAYDKETIVEARHVPTAKLVLTVGGKLVAPDPSGGIDTTAGYEIQGHYLLMSGARLYDLETGKVVWTSDNSVDTHLWPN